MRIDISIECVTISDLLENIKDIKKAIVYGAKLNKLDNPEADAFNEEEWTQSGDTGDFIITICK